MTLSAALNEATFSGAVKEVFGAAALSMRAPVALAQAVGARRRGEPPPAWPELPPSFTEPAGAVVEALAAGEPNVLPLLLPRRGSIEIQIGHLVRRGGELRAIAVKPGMSALVDQLSGHHVRMRWEFEAVAAAKP